MGTRSTLRCVYRENDDVNLDRFHLCMTCRFSNDVSSAFVGANMGRVYMYIFAPMVVWDLRNSLKKVNTSPQNRRQACRSEAAEAVRDANVGGMMGFTVHRRGSRQTDRNRHIRGRQEKTSDREDTGRERKIARKTARKTARKRETHREGAGAAVYTGRVHVLLCGAGVVTCPQISCRSAIRGDALVVQPAGTLSILLGWAQALQYVPAVVIYWQYKSTD